MRRSKYEFLERRKHVDKLDYVRWLLFRGFKAQIKCKMCDAAKMPPKLGFVQAWEGKYSVGGEEHRDAARPLDRLSAPSCLEASDLERHASGEMPHDKDQISGVKAHLLQIRLVCVPAAVGLLVLVVELIVATPGAVAILLPTRLLVSAQDAVSPAEVLVEFSVIEEMLHSDL
ncbi:hypothetical protein G7054_g12832 [Neopestalotiopsis clavispora]|nr:hypothetical protein G7054_g12832 [Neopestalotiopsis clavispora]